MLTKIESTPTGDRWNSNLIIRCSVKKLSNWSKSRHNCCKPALFFKFCTQLLTSVCLFWIRTLRRWFPIRFEKITAYKLRHRLKYLIFIINFGESFSAVKNFCPDVPFFRAWACQALRWYQDHFLCLEKGL